MSETETLASHGFELDKSGKVKSFNGNLFSKQLLKEYVLRFARDGFFYSYDSEAGVWLPVTKVEMDYFIRQYMDEVAPDLWTRGYANACIESLKSKVYCADDPNAQKDFINLQNGMLQISSGRLRKHSQKYFSTVQLPFEFDSEAECPLFLKYLHDVFEDDEERIRLAQEIVGYLLTFEMKAQKAFLLYGTGGNGKSVFLSVVVSLIGQENISYLSLADLENQFNRATLYGKQLILSNENEFGNKQFNTQHFKEIVGGDVRISAAHKNKDLFDFVPTCKIIFSLNSLPSTRDRSDGYYRRLCFLHFSKQFSVDKGTADVDLTKKLEAELSGILNWALKGLNRLKENNFRFSPCKSSEQLLREYRVEQNPFIEFAEECLFFDDMNARTDNTVLYESFKQWCRNNGHRGFADISCKKFWSELDRAISYIGEIPIERKKSGNRRYCQGVSVKQEYRVTF